MEEEIRTAVRTSDKVDGGGGSEGEVVMALRERRGSAAASTSESGQTHHEVVQGDLKDRARLDNLLSASCSSAVELLLRLASTIVLVDLGGAVLPQEPLDRFLMRDEVRLFCFISRVFVQNRSTRLLGLLARSRSWSGRAILIRTGVRDDDHRHVPGGSSWASRLSRRSSRRAGELAACLATLRGARRARSGACESTRSSDGIGVGGVVGIVAWSCWCWSSLLGPVAGAARWLQRRGSGC